MDKKSYKYVQLRCPTPEDGGWRFHTCFVNAYPPPSSTPSTVPTLVRDASSFCACHRRVRDCNKVERILEYTKNVPQEAAPIVQGRRPDPMWPARGALTVKNLTLQ